MARDWPDLMERLTNLGGIAGVLVVAELDAQTRRLSLLRVAADCDEAARIARTLAELAAPPDRAPVVAADTAGGELWWQQSGTRNW